MRQLRDVFSIFMLGAGLCLFAAPQGHAQSAAEDAAKAAAMVEDAIKYDLKRLAFYARGGVQLFSLDALPPRIADMTALKRLNARNTLVSDLGPLAGLSDLQELDLKNAPVGDVRALAGHSGLIHLNLTGTDVADISALAGLHDLESLGLGGTGVSDLSALSNMTGLRSLDISGTRVSDISVLADLRGLERLYLRDTQVSDLSALRNHTALKRLSLGGTLVTSLAPVADIDGLEISPEGFVASGKTDTERCLVDGVQAACVAAAFKIADSEQPDVAQFAKLAERACALDRPSGCGVLAFDLSHGNVLEQDVARGFKLYQDMCAVGLDRPTPQIGACVQATLLSFRKDADSLTDADKVSAVQWIKRYGSLREIGLYDAQQEDFGRNICYTSLRSEFDADWLQHSCP